MIEHGQLAMQILKSLGIPHEMVTSIELKCDFMKPAELIVHRMIPDTPTTFTPILDRYEVIPT